MKFHGVAKDNPVYHPAPSALLTGVIIIGLALVVAGVAILIEQTQLSPNLLWILLILTLLVSSSLILIPYLKQGFTRANLGQKRYQQESLAEFEKELLQLFELPELIKKLAEHIQSGLSPTSLYIFLRDPSTELYICVSDKHGDLATDLRFPANNSLVQSIGSLSDPILNDADFQKGLSHSDKSRLALLGARVISPLRGENELLGWVAIGEGRKHKSYAASDLSYLASLCEKGSIAIEHAQLILGLQQRVRDMDVLSRVAQGVNITPHFDDILELVYSQTRQAILCDDFHITLRNLADGSLYHAFYLEDNDRNTVKENVALPSGFGLEEAVCSSQHPLKTDDYYQECISHQVQPDSREIYAWMGVPLNAGADTIGAIGLGSRDPLGVYTQATIGPAPIDCRPGSWGNCKNPPRLM